MSRESVFVGEFPLGVNGPIQYGVGVKAHAVYLSQYQLLPYNRIEEYFSDQLGIPISVGSLFNFNEHSCTGKVIGRRKYHKNGITKPSSNFAC